MKLSLITLAATVIAASTSFASSLPEGAFRGTSAQISPLNSKNAKDKENDFMSALIKKDKQNADRYYVILAEYTVQDRLRPLHKATPKSNELALVNWVPRMYIYQADKVNELEFSLKPLMVTASHEIEVNSSAPASMLVLDKAGTMEGAVISRLDSKTQTVETVTFNKGKTLKGNSTWEAYVPGMYFGTKVSSGDDYFKKGINTELTTDGIAKFNWSTVTGEFDITEKLPGMFVLKARTNDVYNKQNVEGKIAVFVDIVNWKSFGIQRFTTEEMLIINPNDAKDVGFYYERHYKLTPEEEAEKKRLMAK